MRESLRRLVELQSVDDQLAALEEEAGALPAKRARAEAERQSAEQALHEARQAVEARELERRKLEGRRADRETQLQHLKAQEFQVKSNEAYRVLGREVQQTEAALSETRRAISQAETEELEAIYAVERTEEHAGGVAARVARELQAFDARGHELAKERERLLAARSKVSGDLDVSLLGQYERIAARRKPALVVVSEAVCSGCRVGIPPQNLIDMISGEAVVTCGTCHRILVHRRILGPDTAG